jgi:hypothetical protein
VFCNLPLVLIVSGIDVWIGSSLQSPFVEALLDNLSDLVLAICGMVSVSFMSLVYRRFFGGCSGGAEGEGRFA